MREEVAGMVHMAKVVSQEFMSKFPPLRDHDNLKTKVMDCCAKLAWLIKKKPPITSKIFLHSISFSSGKDYFFQMQLTTASCLFVCEMVDSFFSVQKQLLPPLNVKNVWKVLAPST